jgi:copper chaperone NosL
MKWPLFVHIVITSACAAADPRPVAIDARNDICSSCRMVVSDSRTAAQIVTPGEEPRIFDDIGCLRRFLARHNVTPDAAIFVADHRTGDWVSAADAVYTRSTRQRTPMASGIFAHANRASRDADAAAAGGDDVAASAILKGDAPSRGGR